jgi:hypothetical protein
MVALSAVSMAVFGASQALGHVLNWHARKQDGTFQEQQDLLARIRREESQRAFEQMMAREAQQAELTYNRDVYLSELRIEEAALDHERAKELAQVKADVYQAVQVEKERRERELVNSPFDYTLDEVRAMVAERTRDGAVPVLLIAPFRYADPDYHGPDLDIALRQAWRSAPWAADLNVFGGLIGRPLIRSDVDVQTIRLALSDMPVILVHGHVQANARAWVQLVAWNIGDTSGTRVIEVDLPPMALPERGADSRLFLEFEDSVADSASLVVASYADWFHTLNYSRTPQLHRMLPPDRAAERRLLAADGAALYGACLARGMVSEARARIVQAVVLAEGGLAGQAVETVRPVLDGRGLRTSELVPVAELLPRLATGTVGERLGPDIGRLRQLVLRRQLGMGDMQ